MRKMFRGAKIFRAHRRALDQVALRVGENYVAHRLAIFDVTGAAAEMAVERLGNGFLKLGARSPAPKR
jgi:hypothetical protein